MNNAPPGHSEKKAVPSTELTSNSNKGWIIIFLFNRENGLIGFKTEQAIRKRFRWLVFFALYFVPTEERGNEFRLSGAVQEQNRVLINRASWKSHKGAVILQGLVGQTFLSDLDDHNTEQTGMSVLPSSYKRLSDKIASAYEGKSSQFSLQKQIHFVMVSGVASPRFSGFRKRRTGLIDS